MKWAKRVAGLLLVAAGTTAWWSWHTLSGSLPLLEGEVAIPGLSLAVTIERDAAGVPTVRGGGRLDVARALGFLHGQERFFQMDLARRRAAGELAELFGSAALPLDRHHRLHRMRWRARRAVEQASFDERELLDAYVEGVNAGLEALSVPPFEYLVLRQKPEPWRPEDSALVVYSMYFELNDESGERDRSLGLLYETLPTELARFLSPTGTDFDAAIDGDVMPTPPIPGPDVFDLRGRKAVRLEPTEAIETTLPTTGSNNWAVSGRRSVHGGALMANDMHLRLGVPNIWYRASLSWESGKAVGVTLPGTPFLVAGSNTKIAWGFTNSNGDWVDLVEIEWDPDDPSRYRTPDGWRDIVEHREAIRSAGGGTETLVVRETIWGPLVDDDHAVRWIAHDAKSVNLELQKLEACGNVEEALAVANRAGIPPQNFVVADVDGSIGWTIAGLIPRRFGFDGRLPSSWSSGERGWDGFVAPEDYPRIINPESGVLWTANARVVGGAMLETIGDGGYSFGARARQIRDDLLALGPASERDMLDVQLDDRAVFLERWRELFLEILRDEPELQALRKVIEETWTGRASVDSVAYRAVSELREAVFVEVFSQLTADCRKADPSFSVGSLRQWDGPLWQLVHERPPHLVPPPYKSWEEALREITRRTAENWKTPLPLRTWGARNTSAIRHPLSSALPFLSRWLDMPPRPLPGDTNMPRVQSPSHGASERFVISPGREPEALFHMPGGQSGHPLSPYYGAGQEDWEEGRPSPLLPGPNRYELVLKPAPKLATRVRNE
jgi:penicillin amidase